MSALALCLVEIEKDLFQTLAMPEEFFRKAAFLARLGSGSATRSVYGGFVLWGHTTALENANDEAGSPWNAASGAATTGWKDAILITSPGEKKVSSSQGHGMMNSHPWADARYAQANKNLLELMKEMEKENDEKIIGIIENEALSLHALMLSSDPGYRLTNERTWQIIDEVRRFREKHRFFITFTLDAGPNVHVLYREKDQDEIQAFIREDLLKYCDNGHWIDDSIGQGPVKLD
jgi:diphosphomevalonate decarboxylase